jgi:hypothetical protein
MENDLSVCLILLSTQVSFVILVPDVIDKIARFLACPSEREKKQLFCPTIKELGKKHSYCNSLAIK